MTNFLSSASVLKKNAESKKKKVFKTAPSSFVGDILKFNPLTNSNRMPKTMQRLHYKMRMHYEKIKQKDELVAVRDCSSVSRIPIMNKTFPTGSMYSGEWCYGRMEGSGIYYLPDGSVYTGAMKNGLFAGHGAFMFPNGGVMKGYWIQGVLYSPQYIFQDGLIYKTKNWGYCRMPDRRFHSEIVGELKPSGNIQYASDHPARAIPPGHYDLVEGFYNPQSKEVIHPLTGNVMRIASRNEQDWILKNCRREWEIPVPFNPYLYENWFPKVNEGRHKHISKKSLWRTAMTLSKERSGLMFRIYSVTKKWPRLLKESTKSLIEIGTQMDLSNKMNQSKIA